LIDLIIGHGSMGHTMTQLTHSDLLTRLTHDPWPTDPLSALPTEPHP